MAKTRCGIVSEYFRSLQRMRRIGEVRREDRLEVKGKSFTSGNKASERERASENCG